MTEEFDPMSDIIERLVGVRVRFGDERFREAALKAAVAVGRVALEAAEERAKGMRPRDERGGGRKRGRGLWKDVAPPIMTALPEEIDDD